MGLIQPKPYKVKRNGVWVLIKPEPKEYNPNPEQRGGKLKIKIRP